MGDLKRWHVILFVVALGAVAFGGYWFLSRGSDTHVPNRVVMVDVATGELFAFKTGKRRSVIPPEINPETRTKTLIPVTELEDGGWKISNQFRDALKRVSEPVNPEYVDAETGAVTPSNGSPKSAELASSS
ncbi:MAG: hypothetical protein KDA28_07665 [Phycisphaerales bacterium]|nr:hypothetical protein [Phycisphaerales bacterium]